MSFELRQRLMAEAILVKDSAIRKICVAERCFGSVLVRGWGMRVFFKFLDIVFIYVFHKGVQLFFKYFVQTFIPV